MTTLQQLLKAEAETPRKTYATRAEAEAVTAQWEDCPHEIREYCGRFALAILDEEDGSFLGYL